MIQLNGISIPYPTTGQDLTLGRWIVFQEAHGNSFDEWLAEIEAMPDSAGKQIDLACFAVERAYALMAFFADMDLPDVKNQFKVAQVLQPYNDYLVPIFTEVPADSSFFWGGLGQCSDWVIPEPHLRPDSKMTFGEFIDAKMICQEAKQDKKLDWSLILKLCSVFCRQEGEQYSEAFPQEGSDRLVAMQSLPIMRARQVAVFWEQFNAFCSETFTLFRKSPFKAGHHTSRHYDVWGWVNFLKSIAKTKVFDIPNLGMNSIDCARLAKCVEVLLYASEDKDFSEAQYADMEAESRKK